MNEIVVAALITGVLGFLGVLLTLLARRTEADELARLRAELSGARAEAERYKAAYLGLLELTQGLLEEVGRRP